jgi:hypothetical protein
MAPVATVPGVGQEAEMGPHAGPALLAGLEAPATPKEALIPTAVHQEGATQVCGFQPSETARPDGW